MNSVGSRVFELADGSRTVADIAGVIVAEYEVTAEQARQDVVDFLTQLANHRVLVFSDAREA
ncbi:MAG: PqqD family protein [Chloroflexi bacterium]|nr:PqqD family protein [Chloroflexota bacterium]MCI0576325.1 PqqD family protein [Chloroflexota bacterium]MCI0650124.1 PqqD family protein [Chloroflexota bacterium]MCI0731208.1 PqqD family protein [Chloroflexota bacterium]